MENYRLIFPAVRVLIQAMNSSPRDILSALPQVSVLDIDLLVSRFNNKLERLVNKPKGPCDR